MGRLIVCWRLDRLSRNRPDFTRVLDMCDGGGIQLASVTESLDTSTPTGEAMRDIIAIFARMESRNISFGWPGPGWNPPWPAVPSPAAPARTGTPPTR